MVCLLVLVWGVWKAHSSKRYTIKSAYQNLTSIAVEFNEGFNHVVRLKEIPFKFNIFVWRSMLNYLPTKYNLVKCYILANSHNYCSAGCGYMEDKDHLFVNCNVFGRLWLAISG